MRVQGLLVLVGLALAGLAGCQLERRAEGFEVPEVPPRMVFGAFLGDNDTMTWIRLTSSNPIHFNEWRRITPGSRFWGQTYLSLRSASVVLRNETTGRIAPLTYTDSMGRFSVSVADFPITPGHTYSVEARASGFAPTRGSCTVPNAGVVPFSARFGAEDEVEFTIEVPREPRRYFMVRCIPQGDESYLVREFVCSSEESVNGSIVVNGFHRSGGYLWKSFLLYEVDEHTYQYFITAEQAGGVISSFFTNPMVVYTNIQHGLGVMGAMRYLTQTELAK